MTTEPLSEQENHALDHVNHLLDEYFPGWTATLIYVRLANGGMVRQHSGPCVDIMGLAGAALEEAKAAYWSEGDEEWQTEGG